MSDLSDSIVRLRREGMTYNQIKEELGCSKATISYHLGEGQREKQLARMRDRRNKVVQYVQDLKQRTPCADCGENYPYWIMEFDHLTDKDFNISRSKNWRKSLEQVKAETTKCEIVCANCHRNRTYLRLVSSGSSVMDVSSFYLE